MVRIQMTVGHIRALTYNEKRLYPNFHYVVCNECRCKIGNREVVIPTGFLSDGSSGGPDVGWSWLFHDYLYATHKFADGTHCTRSQADLFMARLLKHERRKLYSMIYWVGRKTLPCCFNDAWVTSGRNGPRFMTLDD